MIQTDEHTQTNEFRPYYNPVPGDEIWLKVTADYRTCLQNDLIEACKKGDPKAQLQVFKSYYKQLFNISHNLVGNARAADEIVRESFMIAFSRTGAYEGMEDFISRLKRMVESRSAENWRKNNVQSPGLMTDKPLMK